MGLALSTVHWWDEEEGVLSNRDYGVGYMGPEGPDEVGCVGWGQLTKDSEGSIHGTLENGLQG